MGSVFGDIWNAVKKGGSDIKNEVGRDVNRVTGKNDKPNPGAYTNMPTNPNNPPGVPSGSSPISLGGSASPFAGAPPGFNQQQFENSLRTDKDLSGVWQTIQGLGGDVWGVISGFLPKNADGSVDWGKVGGDVVGWVKNNAQTIIQGAAAIEQYQRQKKSDQYAQQALYGSVGADGKPDGHYKGVVQEFADNAPLRDAGRAGMLDPTKNAPNLNSLKSIATTGSGNPFAGAPMPTGQQNAPPISLTPPKPPATPQAPHPVPIPVTPPLSLPPQGNPAGAPTQSPTGATMPPMGTMPATPGAPPVDPNAPLPLRTARPRVQPVPGVPSPLSLLNQQQPQY